MVATVPLLLAGAAQGYGAASNQNVDIDNAERREQLRMQYEQYQFDRNVEAGMQQARMAAEHENAKYHRNRADQLTDEESKHARDIEKNELLESGRNKRNAASNAARLEAAKTRSLLRRDNPQSENKQMRELQKTIETDERRLFDLKQSLNDPRQSMGEGAGVIQSEINRIQNRLGQNIMQLQQLQGGQGGQQTTQNNQKLNLQNIMGLQ